VELHPGGSDGTIVPIGTATPGAGTPWAAAAAAAFAAAAFAAAAFIAAASVTAAVVATAAGVAIAVLATASLYIERRATPATEKGVRGIPMIASAFPTNPSLNGDSGGNCAIDIKISATVSPMDIENFFIIRSFPNLGCGT